MDEQFHEIEKKDLLKGEPLEQKKENLIGQDYESQERKLGMIEDDKQQKLVSAFKFGELEINPDMIQADFTEQRNLSKNLQNHTKFLGDSTKMRIIKESLSELEGALMADRGKTPFADYVADIESKYISTILKCQEYLATKSTVTRSDRYILVRDRMLALCKELGYITSLKNKNKSLSDEQREAITNGSSLLFVAKLDTIVKMTNKKVTETSVGFGEDNLDLNTLLDSERYIVQVLTGEISPVEVVKKLEDDGKILMFSLCNLLRRFPRGIHSEYINMAFFGYSDKELKRTGKNKRGKSMVTRSILHLAQDGDGTLCISKIDTKGESRLKLKYQREYILHTIEEKIMNNEQIFGERFTNYRLNWIRKNDLTEDQRGELRDCCVNLIENRVGLKTREERKILKGKSTEELRTIAIRILDGAKYSYKDLTDMRNLVEKDVNGWAVFDNEVEKVINTETVLDRVKHGEASKEKEQEKLVYNLKQEDKYKNLKPEEKKKREEEDKERAWTKEEEGVKNFLADIIYSSDTWNSDNITKDAGKHVGNRIRNVFINHAETLVRMMDDNNLLRNLIYRMPIPGVENMENEINGLMVILKGQLKLATIGADTMEKKIKAVRAHYEKVGDDFFDNLENQINSKISERLDFIQNEIDAATDSLFGEKVKAEKPQIDKTQLTPAQIKALESEELEEIVKDALTGDSGQGLFIKNILRNYFKNVTALDQRSMFAAAIRGAKAIPGLKKQAEEIKKNNVKKEENKKAEGGIFGFSFSGFMSSIKKNVVGEQDDSMMKARKQVSEEKVKEAAGSFIGGFFKGAGPLLQKVLQGIPVGKNAPQYMKDALDDVKSNLLPIPKEIVDAHLLKMVEDSKGEITKIEIDKVLGAASVGQAFLCKIFGPTLPKEGKEVVIKILRPDVHNRMEREKKVMLRCAEETNAGMKATYLGQLARIEEELDLTIEADNVKLGKIYDKTINQNGTPDHVEAMKLCDLVKPSTDYMVIEKSAGDTVDHYRKDLKTEAEKTLKKFIVKKNGNDEEYEKEEGAYKIVAEGDDEEKAQAFAEVSKLIDAARKRQGYLVKLAEKWVQEGLFGSGFYHGDLHAGNIMVSEDGATLIDFGNATKLDEKQKKEVTRMMVGATIGEAELFRDGFHEIMTKTPQMEAIYKAKYNEFTEAIKKIVKLGEPKDAGLRIYAILLKAQELGIEVPSAIQNFSSCQLRLQNTIDEMNKQIEELEKTANKLRTTATEGNNAIINPIKAIRKTGFANKDSAKEYIEAFSNKLIVKSANNKDEFLKKIDIKSDEDRKYFLSAYNSDMVNAGIFPMLTVSIMHNAVNKYTQREITELRLGGGSPKMDFTDEESEFHLRLEKVVYAMRVLERDKEIYFDLDQVCEWFTNPAEPGATEKCQEILEDYKKHFGEQDVTGAFKEIWKLEDKENRTEEDSKRLEALKVNVFNQIEYIVKSKNGNSSDYPMELVDDFQYKMYTKNLEIFTNEMGKDYFKDPKYGEEFKNKVTEFYTINDLRRSGEDDKTDCRTAEQKIKQEELFKEIHELFIIITLASMSELKKEFNNKNYASKGPITKPKLDSFIDVMGEVLPRNVKTAASRLGVFWCLRNHSKLEALR